MSKNANKAAKSMKSQNRKEQLAARRDERILAAKARAEKIRETKREKLLRRDAETQEKLNRREQQKGGAMMDDSWGYADGQVVTFKAMGAIDRAVASIENAARVIESSNPELSSLFQLRAALYAQGIVYGFKIFASHHKVVKRADSNLKSLIRHLENIDAECEQFAKNLIELHYCIINNTESSETRSELSSSIDEMSDDFYDFFETLTNCYCSIVELPNPQDLIQQFNCYNNSNDARIKAFLAKKSDYSGGKQPVFLFTPKIDTATGNVSLETRTIPASV